MYAEDMQSGDKRPYKFCKGVNSYQLESHLCQGWRSVPLHSVLVLNIQIILYYLSNGQRPPDAGGLWLSTEKNVILPLGCFSVSSRVCCLAVT